MIEALRGTNTLLVLDNLESLTKSERDVLFTFIKRLPQGCKAILTSRRRIGSAAEMLILQELGEKAALDTLAKLAETNPALANSSATERLTLYRETGGTPLLLRWTAGQIGRGSCLRVADAIAYLRSCPEGNDPLDFIFGDLVENFTSAETRLLCALTWFTEPVKVSDIAPLAGCSEGDADSALRAMTNRSLVVPGVEPKTFILVPLVADFMQKKKPQGVAEAGDRLEQRAFALLVDDGHAHYRRFRLLEDAWPTLAAALPRFLKSDDERSQVACAAMQQFLGVTGRWDELLALTSKVEELALISKDYRNAGWQAYRISTMCRDRGQVEEMLECAVRAEAHWRQAKASVSSRERALAAKLRATAHSLREDHEDAIAALCDVVGLRREEGRRDDVAEALINLATAESRFGDLDSAERHFQEALQLGHELKDLETITICTNNLAGVAAKRNDWPLAEALARQSLQTDEKRITLGAIATACLRLAEALLRQGQKGSALPHARRALDIHTKLGMSDTDVAREILAQCESED